MLVYLKETCHSLYFYIPIDVLGGYLKYSILSVKSRIEQLYVHQTLVVKLAVLNLHN